MCELDQTMRIPTLVASQAEAPFAGGQFVNWTFFMLSFLVHIMGKSCLANNTNVNDIHVPPSLPVDTMRQV